MAPLQPFHSEDWPLIWRLVEPVFRAGETYAFAPDITEAEAHRAWIEAPQATYVARNENGEIVGTYFLKPNQPGLGSHVANAGYIVGENARGQGIASRMCEHSQDEARRLCFRALQFNLVVSVNETAVRLWQKHGFAIIGALPDAFRHSKLGYVDAYIMYKQLVRTENDEVRNE